MTEEDITSEHKNLISRLRDGDEEAFTTIYKEYWYKMFLVAYRKLENRELAEELVQEIFTRLWKERMRLRINNLDYYLFSSVRYEVIDHIRRQATKAVYENHLKAFSNFEDLNTENQIAFDDLVTTVYKGLDILAEKPREIFRLNRLEHWPVAKIAAHYNLSEKTIDYHLANATKFIRIYLNEMLVSLPYFFFLAY